MFARVQRSTFPWISPSGLGLRGILGLQCYVSKLYQQYLVYQASLPAKALQLSGNVNGCFRNCIMGNSTSPRPGHDSCLSVEVGAASWAPLIPSWASSSANQSRINENQKLPCFLEKLPHSWHRDLTVIASIRGNDWYLSPFKSPNIIWQKGLAQGHNELAGIVCNRSDISIQHWRNSPTWTALLHHMRKYNYTAIPHRLLFTIARNFATKFTSWQRVEIDRTNKESWTSEIFTDGRLAVKWSSC